jgi:hypothetical protein
MSIKTEKVEFDRWYPDKKLQIEAIVDGELIETDAPRKAHIVVGKVEIGDNLRFEIKRVRRKWKVYRELVVTGCDDISMGMSLNQTYLYGIGNNMPVMEMTTKTGTQRESITFMQLLETANRLEGTLGIAKVVTVLKSIGAEELLLGKNECPFEEPEVVETTPQKPVDVVVDNRPTFVVFDSGLSDDLSGNFSLTRDDVAGVIDSLLGEETIYSKPTIKVVGLEQEKTPVCGNCKCKATKLHKAGGMDVCMDCRMELEFGTCHCCNEYSTKLEPAHGFKNVCKKCAK